MEATNVRENRLPFPLLLFVVIAESTNANTSHKSQLVTARLCLYMRILRISCSGERYSYFHYFFLMKQTLKYADGVLFCSFSDTLRCGW